MSKAPFGIIVEAKLKSGTTIAARDAASQLVKSLKSNGSAAKYWGYSTGTGRGEQMMVFVPFTKYADLDRPTTGQLAAQAAKGVNVDEIITGLESNLESVHRSIVEYVPRLSNPPSRDADAPGPNIYHVKAKLKPGNTLRAREIAEKIAEAHRSASGGVEYWGYATASGAGEYYHVFIPFEKYADMDGWASTGEALAAANAGGADALLTEIDGMIEASERTILTYVPTLSNPA